MLNKIFITRMLFSASILLLPICASSEIITVTQESHGHICPGTISVKKGTSETFTIYPANHYTIGNVIVDGANSSISSPWTDYGAQGATDLYSIAYLGDGSSGNRIVIAGGDTTIIRSTDYGATWVNLGTPVENQYNFILKLIYAGNGVVLAGTAWGAGILRSVDYGLTWTPLHLEQEYNLTHVYGLKSLGNGIILAGTTQMVCDGTCFWQSGMILRSTDYGQTWQRVNQAAQEENFISIEYLGRGIVLAGTASATGDIWRSTDYGVTWENLGKQGGETDIDYITYLGEGIAVAATYPNGKMLRSTDYGLTWTDLGKFDEGSFMGDIASAGNGIAVAGTGSNGHIWRTTDYGATWTDLGQQVEKTHINPAYIENGLFLAVTRSPNATILRSSDYGLGSVTTYTFANVQADHSLKASFKPVLLQ